LGAEEKDRMYAGGEVGGWHAPALDTANTSPVPWTVDAMTEYLRTGITDNHAIAAGPMAGVARNLGRVARGRSRGNGPLCGVAWPARRWNSRGAGAYGRRILSRGTGPRGRTDLCRRVR
jgi:hypothetical protein